MLRTVLRVLLIGLGVYMLYLGWKAQMQPPALTGVGFIVIALLFGERKEN